MGYVKQTFVDYPNNNYTILKAYHLQHIENGIVDIEKNLGYYITPQMLGAKGDGVADDTTAFKNALSKSASENIPLIIPYGIYNLTDILDFDGVTIIGLDPEKCVLHMTAQQTAREHFIIASGKVRVSNLKLQQSYGGSVFGLIGCEDSVIENCIFHVGENANNGYFDMYSGNKNVKILNCKFLNYSKQDKGGIWVRNAEETVSKNIIFDKCVFEHMTKDEVVAVWGWAGTVEDVTFRDCTFETIDSEYKPTHMISLGGGGITRNVLMEGCRIYNNYADQYTVKSQAGGNGIIENVKLKNCFVKAVNPEQRNNAVFGGQPSNLVVEDCYVVVNVNQLVAKGCVFNGCYFEINNGEGGFYYGAELNRCYISSKTGTFRIASRRLKATDCVFDFNNIQNTKFFFQSLEENDYVRFNRCEIKNYVGTTHRFAFASHAGSKIECINCVGIDGPIYIDTTEATLTIVGCELSNVTVTGKECTKHIYNNFVDGTFIESGLTPTA